MMRNRFYQERVNIGCKFKRPKLCDGCPGHPDSDTYNPLMTGGFIPPQGPVDAPLMLIGITGGREEEERSEPFVGPSGRKVAAVIRWAAEELGVHSLPVRKLNVFGCRGTVPGFQGRIVNRKSGGMTVREMKACASRWLYPELKKTKAKIVLVLGTEAYSFIIGKRFDNFNKAMGHRLYVPKSGITPQGLGETIYSFGEEVDWSDLAYDK